MPRRAWTVTALGVLLVGTSALGARAASAPASPALTSYLAGLDALSRARWPDAVQALARARQENGRDPAFALAQGVAHALAEQFPRALADLREAERLGLKGREAKLWTYVVETMSGTATAGHAIPVPRSLQGQAPPRASAVSIPGHMIQSGRDYATDYASFVYYEMATPYGKDRGAGATRAPAIQKAMAEAGRWFANRATTRADLAPAHLARAAELHRARKFREALTELGFVRVAYPGDANFKADAPTGEAALELGRAAYEAGQYERAFQIIQSATGTFPRERRREVNDLMLKIVHELNARRGR